MWSGGGNIRKPRELTAVIDRDHSSAIIQGYDRAGAAGILDWRFVRRSERRQGIGGSIIPAPGKTNFGLLFPQVFRPSVVLTRGSNYPKDSNHYDWFGAN